MRLSSILSKAVSCGDSRSKPLDGETEEAGRAAITVARHTTTPEALADYTRRADPAPIPSHAEDLGANPALPQEIQPARAARGDRDHELSPTRNSPTPFAPSSPPVACRAAEARQISGDTSTPRRRGDLVLTLPTRRARFAADRLKVVDTGQALVKDGSGVPRSDLAS